MQSEFRKELEEVINRHSKENNSNTPDWILALYLENCLGNFDTAIRLRAEWYGRLDVPGRGSVPYPEVSEKEQQ